jgi:hypothetical protein
MMKVPVKGIFALRGFSSGIMPEVVRSEIHSFDSPSNERLRTFEKD